MRVLAGSWERYPDIVLVVKVGATISRKPDSDSSLLANTLFEGTVSILSSGTTGLKRTLRNTI